MALRTSGRSCRPGTDLRAHLALGAALALCLVSPAEARRSKPGTVKVAAAPKAATTKVASRPADKPAAPALGPDPFAAEKAAPAAPKVLFEELLKTATPVRDLATLIEPLYARCDEKDDLPRRQCETMRGLLLARLRDRTFVATSDVAPELSPYDASAKEIDMEISGCLACASPPVVAGQPRYLTVRPPKQEGERVRAPALTNHQIAAATKVQADRFLERVAPRLTVQHIFRIGQPFGEAEKIDAKPDAKPDAKADPKAAALFGVSIVPVAHRVYDRCTGVVAASSNPVAGPAKVVADRSCPRRGAEELSQAELVQAERRAALPERLSSRQVEEVLQPLQEKVHECYVEYREPSGTARVALTLGGEGKLTGVVLQPPFDKAEIGICIRSQIKSATFPRFRGEPMRIDYAFQVN